jgi:putative flippase GtrA
LNGIANAKQSLLARLVPKRFHAITDELAKFGTIGLINLGVNFGVFNLLLLLALMDGSEVKAKAVATVVATTCAYFLNRHWTYRNRPKSTLRREYALFFFFNAVGLVIETGFIALAKYGFDQTSLVVLNLFGFVGIAVGTAFRFWAYRTHVFRAEPAVAEPAVVEVPASIVATVGRPVARPATRATALPATREFLAPALGAVQPNANAAVPAATADVADEQLHQELVQLELADLVDENVDKATRR